MTGATGTPVLTVSDLRKEFFGVPVLKDVSLEVLPGRVLGLVGENGAGKSTLVNLIGGVLQPDGGSMQIDAQPYAPTGVKDSVQRGVAFVHQELNLFSNLSIVDNLFITSFPRAGRTPFLARRQARARAAELLAQVGLDVSPDALVETLSPGERQLVEISKALLGRPKLVILDEPTTSLTARETERLFDLMSTLTGQGTSIIYISHILADVLRLADDILVLRDGAVVDRGLTTDFDVARLIGAMVGRSFDSLFPDRTATPGPQRVLEVSGLTQPGVVKDVSLHVSRGEVVGLFGLMGAGRSELARMVFGLDPYQQGTVTVDGEVLTPLDPRAAIARGLAFVTEDRREEGLLMDFDITDNVAIASLPKYRSSNRLVDRPGLVRDVKTISESLRMRARSLSGQPVRSLSGGNQQKVVLGKWLLTKPQVFILDEPTRGIDVGAKHEVYGVVDDLAAKGAGILAISSELEELRGICDRIVVMRQGEVTGEFAAGSFDSSAILRAAFGEVATDRSATTSSSEGTS